MRTPFIPIAALASVFSLSVTLEAQTISFGVKGGVPFTHWVERGSGVHPEDRPYTVGPMLEIALPSHFAIEIDGLDRRLGYSVAYPATSYGDPFTVRVRASSSEFPVLAKFYIP